MDLLERIRRCKRYVDGYITFRKAFLLLILLFTFLIYMGPWIFKWIFSPKGKNIDPIQRCLDNSLESILLSAQQFDVNVKYDKSVNSENDFSPFVGNGYIGVGLDINSPLYIQSQSVLSLAVPYYPIITVNADGYDMSGAIVTKYTSGIVYRYQCIKRKRYSLDVKYDYYAHRMLPSLLVQDIKIVNPLDEDVILDLIQIGVSDWKGVSKTESTINNGGAVEDIVIYIGEIESKDREPRKAIVILQTKIPNIIQVKRQSSVTLHIVTSIHYDDLTNNVRSFNLKEQLTLIARRDLERGLAVNFRKLREDHSKVWNQLWSSGLSISYSKAADSLNGDRINATIYAVLSHSRSPLYEIDTGDDERKQLLSWLDEPNHCYDGHHTLQASKLWSHLENIDEMIHIVRIWKLTLGKQGCHMLMKAGADGILQALLLSFGAFKFSNHHLEFGMQPKDLHRDYLFRRISYGNATHLNISVIVEENNKAVLHVVLDRSDKNYYACDGGCLDPPVQLSQEKQSFPVKLTEPPTAILYITSNKQHMEELKHTIHVKEIAEAPAHEHHVIALHRHGHHFGGLPTMFWVSIMFLVAIFHLFLFKLIYNEYCASQEKFRTRHSL